MSLIAIFDIGKTNKKVFLFNEDYQIVLEKSEQFPEIKDEDGDPCEDLERLNSFVLNAFREIALEKKLNVKAINFATYGASFVFVGEHGKPVAPLYNYLKPYPEALKKTFYDTYGGETEFAFRTASPVLGSLNSGMQIYRLKYEKPDVFRKIKYALHLPQYVSFLLTGKAYSDLTSIGSHTNLWDFTKNNYHSWVNQENADTILPPVISSDETNVIKHNGRDYVIGVGLHDSSAALIPYLVSFHQPFVLISTGTWCISLNPFNQQPLTADELACDCLSYLQFKGEPVKASRFFAGHFHDKEVERIAAHFNKSLGYFKTIEYNPTIAHQLQHRTDEISLKQLQNSLTKSLFEQRALSSFASASEAYHQLIFDLVRQQHASTQLVVKGSKVDRIFVDGGFGKNPVYMNMLASFFPDMEVFAASVSQATAMGAALAIHKAWNTRPLPENLIELKSYSTARTQQV